MSHTPEIEFQSKEKIGSFQEGKLAELISYLEKHSPFYKKHFASNRIKGGSIKILDDLKLVPPTTKDDLQKSNWDFLCVPKSEIVEYTATSGTMGSPVTIALTRNDLQ